jgi:hypothetical protein
MRRICGKVRWQEFDGGGSNKRMENAEWTVAPHDGIFSASRMGRGYGCDDRKFWLSSINALSTKL